MKKQIIKIEEHFYETKTHKVKVEYRIFHDPYVYEVKTPSQLTKVEKEHIKKQYFHF